MIANESVLVWKKSAQYRGGIDWKGTDLVVARSLPTTMFCPELWHLEVEFELAA
jgi:hypothetical protein